MLLCAVVLRTPPNDFTVNGLDVRVEKVTDHDAEGVAKDAAASWSEADLIESLRSPAFFFKYLMFFAKQIFGLVALSRLSNMAQDLFGQSRTEGVNVVSINGVFNCRGRLCLPMLADVAIKTLKTNPPFARKLVFLFNLVVQIVVVAVLPHLINRDNYDGFRAVMWTLTFTYGGGFGTIPCFLTDMVGPYNIGALHGMILTAWSIGGVGGGLGFTSVFDRDKPSAAGATCREPSTRPTRATSTEFWPCSSSAS